MIKNNPHIPLLHTSTTRVTLHPIGGGHTLYYIILLRSRWHQYESIQTRKGAKRKKNGTGARSSPLLLCTETLFAIGIVLTLCMCVVVGTFYTATMTTTRRRDGDNECERQWYLRRVHILKKNEARSRKRSSEKKTVPSKKCTFILKKKSVKLNSILFCPCIHTGLAMCGGNNSRKCVIYLR